MHGHAFGMQSSHAVIVEAALVLLLAALWY